MKSLGLSYPRTQTLQQAGRKAMEAPVATLFPPDVPGGQAWESVAMGTWAEALPATLV